VPLEEARALEGTGQCHLLDGNLSLAAGLLQEALCIYQHIGAPAARPLQQTLASIPATKESLPASTQK
jgi:hypothetical protein